MSPRNGRTHDPVVLPPALAREVTRWEPPDGEVECEVCLTHYDPRAEGNPPTTQRLAMCESCFLREGRQAA